ncbi:shK domain-like domain-containing protein [Ditylenchus destructor]|nr:shK domain-like domain-containing protein [Ditylenchus destructor]
MISLILSAENFAKAAIDKTDGPCIKNEVIQNNAGVCQDDPAFNVNNKCAIDLGTGTKRKIDEFPDDKCKLPANGINAGHCKYTCATCCLLPEHECEDDKSPMLPCKKENCQNEQMKKYMEVSCRATCGWCNAPLPPDPKYPGCVDKMSSCGPWRKYCSDPNYKAELKKNCARTCNFCEEVSTGTGTGTGNGTGVATVPSVQPQGTPVIERVDTADNCEENIDLCDNEIYGSIMMEYCPETCIGTQIVSDEDCEDQNDNCVTWDQNFGFCDSEFYSEDSKADVCEYTCGFC